jgi:alanine racemase
MRDQHRERAPDGVESAVRTARTAGHAAAADTWVEVDGRAYRHNLEQFRRLLGPDTILMAVIKGNAYGHGMETLAPIAARHAGALGVNSIDEAVRLLEMDLRRPIYVLGPVSPGDLEECAALPLEFTAASQEALRALARGARKHESRPRVHVKVETGCHRQGFGPDEIDGVCRAFEENPELVWAGLSTHFANIEDTTDHSYARRQLQAYLEVDGALRGRGIDPGLRHTACSAATIVMPETHLDMVRVGIGSYGLWPSRETLVSAKLERGGGPALEPVLTWKTRIAQIKSVPDHAYIGYGCTHRTTRPTRLAVLPIGYWDGYDRRLSGAGRVLVRGRRAPVLGRVCMNMTMVDVTDVAGAQPGDEVVLLGRQDDEAVTAQDLASLCQTIVYEITTRIAPHIPRRLVGTPD